MAETLRRGRGRKRGNRNGSGESASAAQPAGGGDLPADPTVGHNSEARRALIVEVIGEMRQLEAEIESVRATIKAKNKKIADEYRKLKTQLGMSRKDVERARWLAELEENEARVSSLSHFKEVYEALRPGETLDWLEAAERAERSREALAQPPQAPNGGSQAVDPEAVADAAGLEAGSNGLPARSCPYDQTTQSALHDRWMAAWERGQGKIAFGAGGEASWAGPGGSAGNPFAKATH